MVKTNNNDGSYPWGWRMGINERWQGTRTVMTKTKWLMTESEKWRSELHGRWWRGPLEGGWRMETPSCPWVWQAAETFKVMTCVTHRLVRILDRSAASSSVHSTYKNQHLSFISLFCAETSLSERVRHLSELNRSLLSATRSTRSLLSSVSDFIRSPRYSFSFYICHGRDFKLLASVSSLFYFRPSVLGFVTPL